MEIEAQGIAIRFGPMALLEGVDLAMRGGEMVGLIGPNGSGKTTLLRVLANLRAPEAGRVHYAGRTAAEIGTRELSRQIAYLAQGGAVHWPMRVETLVALGRLPHRRPFQGHDAADRHAIERAMTAADVAYLRTRTMGQISGGERLRVLLARALAVDARVLLADEPIAALDPLHQLQVMELLRMIASEGRGVIVVLHDLALATRFCDRLILLARGGILVEGAPAHVLTDAHVAEAYGVEVVRGERDGVPFLLPWKPSAQIRGRRAVNDAANKREFLAAQMADHEANWSLGTFGAIAEFMRDADEPVALSNGDARVVAVTARGGIQIEPREHMRLFASESTTRESWSHRVSLCLPQANCAMNGRTVLTALGPDTQALREEDRQATLFDLGLGALQVDVCIRVADPKVTAELLSHAGRPLFEPEQSGDERHSRQQPAPGICEPARTDRGLSADPASHRPKSGRAPHTRASQAAATSPHPFGDGACSRRLDSVRPPLSASSRERRVWTRASIRPGPPRGVSGDAAAVRRSRIGFAQATRLCGCCSGRGIRPPFPSSTIVLRAPTFASSCGN